jgi:hypothetical protein
MQLYDTSISVILRFSFNSCPIACPPLVENLLSEISSSTMAQLRHTITTGSASSSAHARVVAGDAVSQGFDAGVAQAVPAQAERLPEHVR